MMATMFALVALAFGVALLPVLFGRGGDPPKLPAPRHPTVVDGHDMGGLAERVGDLRYDALEEFLAALADKLRDDAAADRGRGRAKLANALEEASNAARVASAQIGVAWRISRPYMPAAEQGAPGREP